MSALAGGDSIDDADALRSGGTGRILGFTVKAASTLGTFGAQLSLASRPPARPGQPRAARPGLGCRRRDFDLICTMTLACATFATPHLW